MKTERTFSKGSFDICKIPQGDTLSSEPKNPVEGDDDFFFHPCFGWISASSFIFSPNKEQGIEGLSEFIAANEATNCTLQIPINQEQQKQSSDTGAIAERITVAFNSTLEKLQIDICGIIEIKICLNMPQCIFIKTDGKPWIGVDSETLRVQHEASPGTETAEPVNGIKADDLNERIDEIPQPSIPDQLSRDVVVGIVEPASGNHYEYIRALVKHLKMDSNGSKTEKISHRHIPVSTFRSETFTVFDLICALADPEARSEVDVVNISMGYYSCFRSICLTEVLKLYSQPIVCSAGNGDANNDHNFHWPSNFSIYLENVIAVAAVDDSGALYSESNFGPRTVTCAGAGTFDVSATDKIAGTSIAAAWVSRSVAAAISMKGVQHGNLDEIVQTLQNPSYKNGSIYKVQRNGSGTLPVANQVIFKSENGAPSV